METEDGIRMRRFPVKPPKGEAFGPVNQKLLGGDDLRPSEGRVFEKEMFRCPVSLQALRRGIRCGCAPDSP